MKTKVISIAALIAVALWAADKVQPLNAKLGLWEITSSQQMTGAVPISPETLAKLPPEQRAKIEARFTQRSGKPMVSTRQTCMTDEKRSKSAFGEERQGCVRTIVGSTSQLLQLHEECTQKDGTRMSSDAKFELSGDSTMKGTVKVKAAHGDNITNVSLDLSGKWVGADCGTVK